MSISVVVGGPAPDRAGPPRSLQFEALLGRVLLERGLQVVQRGGGVLALVDHHGRELLLQLVVGVVLERAEGEAGVSGCRTEEHVLVDLLSAEERVLQVAEVVGLQDRLPQREQRGILDADLPRLLGAEDLLRDERCRLLVLGLAGHGERRAAPVHLDRVRGIPLRKRSGAPDGALVSALESLQVAGAPRCGEVDRVRSVDQLGVVVGGERLVDRDGARVGQRGPVLEDVLGRLVVHIDADLERLRAVVVERHGPGLGEQRLSERAAVRREVREHAGRAGGLELLGCGGELVPRGGGGDAVLIEDVLAVDHAHRAAVDGDGVHRGSGRDVLPRTLGVVALDLIGAVLRQVD
jgi:hypothetical protein